MEGEEHYRSSVQRNEESRSYQTIEQSMGSGCGPGKKGWDMGNLGYWQVPIRESHRSKTVFVTADGLYQFKVMAMGFGIRNFSEDDGCGVEFTIEDSFSDSLKSSDHCSIWWGKKRREAHVFPSDIDSIAAPPG
ncbi:Uncharacterized protein APZ42_033436 [Daphnia magna]|uniref:Uncharacterized protein n=1 Tax=Daphnia magna TaxID=35525 RepID=A0A164L3U9_9CRUS|nr:Uncharacterized protein APZ42_033436 [Daphnia magna]